MSLIPKGPRQGWVIVWGGEKYYEGTHVGQTRGLYYSLINPSLPFGNGSVESHCIQMPTGLGDLFCAGHAWNANGDLVIMGGTGKHPSPACLNETPPIPGNAYSGSNLAFVWEPPKSTDPLPWTGTWHMVGAPGGGNPWLDFPRWYPSITALGPDPVNDWDMMLVSGGLDEIMSAPFMPVNSYEVWQPDVATGNPGGLWVLLMPSNPQSAHNWNGPALLNLNNPKEAVLGNYPRAHLLSTRNSSLNDLGRVFTAGMFGHSDRVSHHTNAGVWDAPGMAGVWNQTPAWRQYGSSVLLPIIPDRWDQVLAMGGHDKAGTILSNTDRADGALTPVNWQPDEKMPYPRWVFNSVLLPDTRLFVVGGETKSIHEGCSEEPAYYPVIYDPAGSGSKWSWCAAEQEGPHKIIRDYHSTALLLPNGEVLCGGGESRHEHPVVPCLEASGPGALLANPTPKSDYNIFRPAYAAGNRITIAPPPGGYGSAHNFQYGMTYNLTHSPIDGAINRVVLMRAGSVTHHCDPNQRCVSLNFTSGAPAIPNSLNVTLPSKSSGILPRGYYMMFFVTNEPVSPQGVPSLAQWVRVQ